MAITGFWRSYFLPAHKLAISRLKNMKPATFRPLLGAWLGMFVATEGFGFITYSGLADDRQANLVNLIFTGLLSQTMTFYVYFLLPRRTLEQEQNITLSPTQRMWRDSGVDLVAESLRVAAFVLLWAIPFVVPGIFKALRWGFVPYIVMTDANYQKGEVHARNESNRLIRGITWAIALIWLAYVGVEFAVSYAEGFSQGWDFKPLAFAWRLGLSVVSFYVLLYSVLLDFGIYQIRRALASGGGE